MAAGDFDSLHRGDLAGVAAVGDEDLGAFLQGEVADDLLRGDLDLQGVAGGVVGMAIAYFTFNGWQASTLNFTSFSQITFAFAVTPALAVQALVYALILGLLGGLFPSFRAAWQPIVRGLREL